MAIRSLAAALAAGFAMLVSGCVYSDNGIVLPDRDDSIFDASLLGEWEVEWKVVNKAFPPSQTRVSIERQDPGLNPYVYRALTEPRPDDPFGCIKGVRLFRLRDALFLDFPFPDCTTDRAAKIQASGGQVPTIHLIKRLRMRGDRFVLDELDVDFLKSHPTSIPHKIGGWRNGQAQITGSPEALRTFLVENASNGAAWGKDTRQLFRKVTTKPTEQAPPVK